MIAQIESTPNRKADIVQPEKTVEVRSDSTAPNHEMISRLIERLTDDHEKRIISSIVSMMTADLEKEFPLFFPREKREVERFIIEVKIELTHRLRDIGLVRMLKNKGTHKRLSFFEPETRAEISKDYAYFLVELMLTQVVASVATHFGILERTNNPQ